LHATPLDVAALFKQQRDALPGSWVFTSATLEVGHDFSHFAQRLGLDDYQQGNWSSPFDYQQAVPVLQASQGRAFLLFTSYRALNEGKSFAS